MAKVTLSLHLMDDYGNITFVLYLAAILKSAIMKVFLTEKPNTLEEVATAHPLHIQFTAT